MTIQNPFKYFKTSPEIICLAVMYYVRYPLSSRQVEDILHERGIDICHETVRFWVNRFGAKFAKEIRKNRVGHHSNWQWHLDEVFVKISGERFYLWRAVDHEGEVLECFITKRRNKAAANKFLIKTMRKHGAPKIITTDKLPSYGAAFREIGVADKQLCGGRSNNRCENSHSLPGSGLFANHEKGHFDDENERCSALKQSQRSKNLSVITAKYTTTSITKDISKPGRLTNKNAVLL
jgi:putative transposase